MKRRRGQAMVEYSVLTWFLFALIFFVANVPFGGNTIFEAMVNALQMYFDSITATLNSPF